MKPIKSIMVLVVSIGCWLPGVAVRAEAPTPKGGCWSREVAMRPTDDPKAITTVKGRVVAIERNNEDRPLAAKNVVTWARVRSNTGEEKTIYLGSDLSLRQQHLKLKVSDVVEVRGVQTAPSRQSPTIIANTVKKSDRVWKIDNLADKPTGVKWCKYNG
jgi:hypothetical protein